MLSEAPKPAAPPKQPAATKTTEAIAFVCLSIGVFLLCSGLLSLVLWYHWRKSNREYDRYMHQRRLAEQHSKQEGSIKQQVRLPVIIVNPDDKVEYGRKESRFFPSWPKAKSRDGKQDKAAEFPQTPPPGAYFIEGAPGFFEVDLEVGMDAKTAPPTPRTASRSAKTPMEMLSAAISKLSPRPAKDAATAGWAQDGSGTLQTPSTDSA